MIIYNVTVNVDNDVQNEWVSWMQNTHIPDVMKTGYFTGYKFSKVLADDPAGQTYSVQYYCDSLAKYDEYQKTEAPRLQSEHSKKFEGKFVAFRTLLEVLSDG